MSSLRLTVGLRAQSRGRQKGSGTTPCRAGGARAAPLSAVLPSRELAVRSPRTDQPQSTGPRGPLARSCHSHVTCRSVPPASGLRVHVRFSFSRHRGPIGSRGFLALTFLNIVKNVKRYYQWLFHILSLLLFLFTSQSFNPVTSLAL